MGGFVTFDILEYIPQPAGRVANLGAGKCDNMVSMRIKKLRCDELINVEIWEPSLNQIRLEYGEFEAKQVQFVQEDVLVWLKEKRDIDIALIFDVIEHFDKETGIQLIDDLLVRHGCSYVVLWVPINECPQGDYDGNPWQRHLSTWRVEDFNRWSHKLTLFDGFHEHVTPPADAAVVVIGQSDAH